MVFGLVFTTSHTAVPVPLVMGMAAMGTPWATSVEGTEGKGLALPSVTDSLLTNWAYPVYPLGLFALAALPPGSSGGTIGDALLFTLLLETKMVTPFGTLLKVALRRVPKSVKPATWVALMGTTKLDSE